VDFLRAYHQVLDIIKKDYLVGEMVWNFADFMTIQGKSIGALICVCTIIISLNYSEVTGRISPCQRLPCMFNCPPDARNCQSMLREKLMRE